MASVIRDRSRAAALVAGLLLAGCEGGREAADVRATSGDPLVVYSSADTAVFAGVIADFHRLHRDIPVRYVELDSGEAYARYLREVATRRRTADVILSSAMDLQLKLANDGEARAVPLADAAHLPTWAKWRDAAFGFTFEPAVIVCNRQTLAGRPPPRSRAALAAAIGRDPAFWRGRIGTYDIAQSRVGYLLITQDARQNPRQQAVIDALASAHVRMELTSAAVLDRVERGELACGYNILGSYAERRRRMGGSLAIVYPTDYALVLSRTAIVTRAARHAGAATTLLAYLLSRRGQEQVARAGSLNPIRTDMGTDAMRQGLSPGQVGRLRPIALGPGLLVYLDQRKRARLLGEWQAAMAAAHASLATASPLSMSDGRRRPPRGR